MSQEINESLQKVHVPSFEQFSIKLNEDTKEEMKIYSELVECQDKLIALYGDKAVAKTGLLAALKKINETLILSPGAKQTPTESQPAQDFAVQAQEPAQAQTQAQEPAQDLAAQAQATQAQELDLDAQAQE